VPGSKGSTHVASTSNFAHVLHKRIAAHFGPKEKSRTSRSARTSSTLSVRPKPLTRAPEAAAASRTSTEKCFSEITVLPWRKRCQKRCIRPREESTTTPEAVSGVLWKSWRQRSAGPFSRESSGPKQLRSEQVDVHRKSNFSKRRKTHRRL